MTIITLTTDFGSTDHEAGVLKGVIWSISPAAKIVDLSHDIPAHDILEAALLLWRAVPYFPPGTIHLAVVDPGVGTARRGIAAQLGDYSFVGPDNGLISLILERVTEAQGKPALVQLDRPEFWLPDVSHIFHGRDIFAPVAAHLASGITLEQLGSAIHDPVLLNIPRPVRTSIGWRGQIIHADHFGNLATNIHASQLGPTTHLVITVNQHQIDGLVSTFGERPPGTLVALFDSSGSLAISVVNGSAKQLLGANIGDEIELQVRI